MALEKSSINVDDFKKLLDASPNLYHLAVNYEIIKSFFDHESICSLLERRMTHLLIGVSSTTSIQSTTDSLARFSSIFPLLKHLYFHTETKNQPVESLILAIFKYLSHWKFLVSFGVANIVLDEKISSEDIHQWVIDNSTLNNNDSFLVDYSDNTFRLWL